jgi:hypothetical protein
VLAAWTDRLRRENGDQFPSHVTAFRPGMAVHGRFGQPCPVCQTAVQRIRYAANEVNYCPRCQTGGKLLADRSLKLDRNGRLFVEEGVRPPPFTNSPLVSADSAWLDRALALGEARRTHRRFDRATRLLGNTLAAG